MELLIEPFSKRRAQARGSRTYCGLVIDAEYRLAFVAYEENARMAVFDLEAKKDGHYSLGWRRPGRARV